jgi:hypothetical protein
LALRQRRYRCRRRIRAGRFGCLEPAMTKGA